MRIQPTRETFSHTTKPDDDRVVEVLLEPLDGNGWVIQQARWLAHLGHWIRDWTGARIIDEVVGWRPKTECACCRVPKVS
jgi:glutamate-1-semialdehyde aminotransferase